MLIDYFLRSQTNKASYFCYPEFDSKKQKMQHIINKGWKWTSWQLLKVN